VTQAALGSAAAFGTAAAGAGSAARSAAAGGSSAMDMRMRVEVIVFMGAPLLVEPACIAAQNPNVSMT
jgi:hypothetical protein